MMLRQLISVALFGTLLALPTVGQALGQGQIDDDGGGGSTQTPIKHLVIIFQENISFDHYFGTYPKAQNPAGEPRFVAAADTPSVNGLDQALLTANTNAANPARLDRSQPITCDMDHGYTDEQKAFDH